MEQKLVRNREPRNTENNRNWYKNRDRRGGKKKHFTETIKRGASIPAKGTTD